MPSDSWENIGKCYSAQCNQYCIIPAPILPSLWPVCTIAFGTSTCLRHSASNASKSSTWQQRRAFIQRCSYEKQTPPGCHLCQRLQHIYTKFAHGSGVLLLVCSHITTCSCTWIYIGINKGCLVQQGKSVSYEKLHRGRNVFFTLSLLPPPPPPTRFFPFLPSSTDLNSLLSCALRCSLRVASFQLL